MGPVLLGTLLFLVAFIGTLWLFFVLNSANVTGLRGGPVPGYPMEDKNQRLAFAVLWLLFVAGTGLVTSTRKRLFVRVEVLVGMWSALLLLGLQLSWFWGFQVGMWLALHLSTWQPWSWNGSSNKERQEKLQREFEELKKRTSETP